MNDSLRSGSSFGHFHMPVMGFGVFAQRLEGSRGWQQDDPRIKDAKPCLLRTTVSKPPMTVLEQTVAGARVQASSGALLHPPTTPCRR